MACGKRVRFYLYCRFSRAVVVLPSERKESLGSPLRQISVTVLTIHPPGAGRPVAESDVNENGKSDLERQSYSRERDD